MQEEEYKQFEIKQNGMTIILEFPKKPVGEETIKKEVKSVLSYVLQEYLEKNFSFEI